MSLKKWVKGNCYLNLVIRDRDQRSLLQPEACRIATKGCSYSQRRVGSRPEVAPTGVSDRDQRLLLRRRVGSRPEVAPTARGVSDRDQRLLLQPESDRDQRLLLQGESESRPEVAPTARGVSDRDQRLLLQPEACRIATRGCSYSRIATRGCSYRESRNRDQRSLLQPEACRIATRGCSYSQRRVGSRPEVAPTARGVSDRDQRLLLQQDLKVDSWKAQQIEV